jgi:hypothetical protein
MADWDQVSFNLIGKKFAAMIGGSVVYGQIVSMTSGLLEVEGVHTRGYDGYLNPGSSPGKEPAESYHGYLNPDQLSALFIID